ncbi:MAG: metal-sensitive transcriptional regulator [Firmicutes bacterium]|nr:metal-sensitive transcriptional regulator [Bacillota bacterium]
MNSICCDEKKKLILRLRRLEGQIRGLQRMVEEDKYCVDILTQIVAAKGALQKVALKILDDHMHGCVKRAIQEENAEKNEEIVNELMTVLAKFSS